MNFSNTLVGFLNFLTLLLSIPFLGTSIYLAHRATTDCLKYLQTPIIIVGVFLLAVSIAGLIGACCKVNWLLWFYLFVMFVLMVVLFSVTVFAFVVTNKGAGEVLSNRGYKEYKLGDYSNWLQKRVTKMENWEKIKSCLIEGKVCQFVANENRTSVDEFYAMKLDPVESGCCRPPESCNFTYQTPTTWVPPNTTLDISIPDCKAWSNDENTLCYNCESCQAGMLDNLKSHWKRVAIVNFVFLVCLIIAYSLGCCAFRNNQWHNPQPPYHWKPYA